MRPLLSPLLSALLSPLLSTLVDPHLYITSSTLTGDSARGVSEAEWQAVHDALLEFQNGNFWFRNFGGCGGLAECCYYCFPLGPLQACLCSSNPLTKSMCIEPEMRAVDVATAAIVPVVSKHNVYFAFRVPFDDERAARFWAPTVVPQ